MGSTFLGGGMVSMMVTTWQQALQEGESEDSSFTSSSMSNFKSPPPSAHLNEMDEYMYMLEGGNAHASQYNDSMSYQRLPSLLEQPLLSISNTSLNSPITTKDLYFIKHEESPPCLPKHSYFFNPLDPKSLPHPLDLLDSKAHSTIVPSFLTSIKQKAFDQQTLHLDHAQVPSLKSDYALLHDPSPLTPSPPSPFVSDDSYSQHLLDNYGAGESHVECLAQHCNEALESTSNGAYMPYLPCTSFSTSPALPSIISTNSSPITSLEGHTSTITSLASHTSTIADTASADAASMKPPDHCQDNHFISGNESMMPSLMSLQTRSSMSRTSKGKNVEIDKLIKKKRKRTRSRKNSEELESQRMTHIAVERNRRRQMNQHLNDLRSLMPSSYIQRGDQASIVGGAIRLVEELEQVLESLHLQKQIRGVPKEKESLSHLNGDKSPSISKDSYACSESTMVNVQVEMTSLSSVLVKVMAPKRHHQLLHTLQALHFLSLRVLHLNITTFDISILYSFNLKMENDCQFQTALELAKSIQHVFETPKL